MNWHVWQSIVRVDKGSLNMGKDEASYSISRRNESGDHPLIIWEPLKTVMWALLIFQMSVTMKVSKLQGSVESFPILPYRNINGL